MELQVGRRKRESGGVEREEERWGPKVEMRVKAGVQRLKEGGGEGDRQKAVGGLQVQKGNGRGSSQGRGKAKAKVKVKVMVECESER